MKRLGYSVRGSVLGCYDEAIVGEGEQPHAALVEAVVQTIATDVMVKVGEVEMHLAAWIDPEHWAEDWAARGIAAADVDGLVAGAVRSEAV